MTREQIKKIGREYANIGGAELAKEFGITKQRVQQIVAQLRSLGVPIPKTRISAHDFNAIAEELKAEWKNAHL